MRPFGVGRALAAVKSILLLSLLCLVPLASQAGVILSENFDALTPQLGVTSAGAFQAIGGTNVDIVGGALFGSLCQLPTSGNCVDLDGSGGNPQGVLQSVSSFTLQPGMNYFLSFDLIGSGRSATTSTTVSFGPYNQTFVLTNNDVTTGIVLNALVTVSSTTSTSLTFTSNTPGQEGSILDNVSISEQSSAVPEPGTLALIFSGGLSLLGARKRWFRAS